MTVQTFGPHSRRVLRFLGALPDLSPTDVGTVTRAWRKGDDRDRAEAWSKVHRAATGSDRFQILTAASVARREAMELAGRYDWADWAFWAAAADAGAAVSAADRIGSSFVTLVTPLAAVMPWLSSGEGDVRPGDRLADIHPASGGASTSRPARSSGDGEQDRGQSPSSDDAVPNAGDRVVIDLNRCQSYGQCVFAAPEVFRWHGEESLEYVYAPDEALHEQVAQAVAACPVQAISVGRASTALASNPVAGT